jgi:glycosyltransferase involved in cell wall biosynthesis
LKILYDISILGIGHYHHGARSGIFRVVENLAKELVKMDDLNIGFCSCHSMETLLQSIDYINSTPALKKVHFSKLNNGYFKRKRYRSQMNVLANKLQSATQLNALEKFTLKARYQRARALQKFYPSVNRKFIPIKDLSNAAVFHDPFFPLSDEIKNSGVKHLFVTCYDLIPIYKPEFCHPDVTARMHRFLDSLTYNTWILCISKSARNELLTYMGNKIDPAKTIVTELAASEQFYVSTNADSDEQVRIKYGIPDGQYMLSICTLEPRKNIERAIHAFVQLSQQQHINDLSLVLVGNKGFKSEELISSIDCDSDIKKRIIITGFVVDADLAALYSGSLLFVYPSLYEGFGLPPLEAMQCGIPVITSNSTSLPEVVGNAGIMVEPTDTDALCQAMWQLYSQPSLRQELSQKSVIQAGKFSWRICAEKTVAAYRASLLS